jgi:hypothetical protein
MNASTAPRAETRARFRLLVEAAAGQIGICATPTPTLSARS